MSCDPDVLKNVPLFSLLDDEELAVLASQVERRSFAARQRIYRIEEPAARAYVVVSGLVKVTTVDDDQQEVDVDEPGPGEFFGFASMIDQTPHQTTAVAEEDTVCVEVDREDIAELLRRKPMAGMDLLATLGRQIHATHRLIRIRAQRNPNELIEQEATLGERVADGVARFGGSWMFIISFLVYAPRLFRGQCSLTEKCLGSLPFYPSQSASVHARRPTSSSDHDEPKSTRRQGSPER